jgi:hypothetical protein
MYKESNLSNQINNIWRDMYKESNLSDQINNMGIDKCTKKVIYQITYFLCTFVYLHVVNLVSYITFFVHVYPHVVNLVSYITFFVHLSIHMLLIWLDKLLSLYISLSTCG